MKCQACEQETLLPFRCPYCGGGFCSDHRFPENHACPRIEQARAERQGQVMTPQGYNSYQLQLRVWSASFKRKVPHSLEPKGSQTHRVAAALVVGIGISIGLIRAVFCGFRFNGTGFDDCLCSFDDCIIFDSRNSAQSHRSKERVMG